MSNFAAQPMGLNDLLTWHRNQCANETCRAEMAEDARFYDRARGHRETAAFHQSAVAALQSAVLSCSAEQVA